MSNFSTLQRNMWWNPLRQIKIKLNNIMSTQVEFQQVLEAMATQISAIKEDIAFQEGRISELIKEIEANGLTADQEELTLEVLKGTLLSLEAVNALVTPPAPEPTPDPIPEDPAPVDPAL